MITLLSTNGTHNMTKIFNFWQSELLIVYNLSDDLPTKSAIFLFSNFWSPTVRTSQAPSSPSDSPSLRHIPSIFCSKGNVREINFNFHLCIQSYIKLSNTYLDSLPLKPRVKAFNPWLSSHCTTSSVFHSKSKRVNDFKSLHK